MRLFLKKKKPPKAEKKSAPVGRGFYLFAGLALAPFLAGALWALWPLLRDLAGRRLPWMPAAGGVAAYFAGQLVFQKPMRAYVLGHELSHAIAAWLSGFRVKSMRVSEKGGEVVLTGTNVGVALAPYCLPFYTLLTVVAFKALDRFPAYAPGARWLSFAVGFTFAFHVALTVYALAQNQPDLRHAGPFPSIVVILLANTLVLVLLLKLLFAREVSLRDYGTQFAASSLLIWDHILRGALWAGERVWEFAQEAWRRRGAFKIQ